MSDDCPRCAYYRAMGEPFCPACGKEFDNARTDECPECWKWRAKGSNFCMACGRRLGPAPEAPRPGECPECPTWRAKGSNFCMACGRRLGPAPEAPRPGDCPECPTWRAKGSNFCMACGRQLNTENECSDCAKYRSMGSNFCMSCGRRFDQVHANAQTEQTECTKNHTYRVLTTAALAAFCFCLVVEIVYGLIHISDIFGCLSSSGKAIFVIAYLTIIACTAYAFVSVWRKTDGGRTDDALYTSGIGAAAAALCVSLFITIVYALVLAAGGEEIDASWLDSYSEYQLAYLFIVAGPEEEFLFRLLPIGIPMMIVALCCGRGKEAPRYLMGGFGISRMAWVFIIFSSVIFGLAHYDGWGWTKILDAFAGGVIFGYIYVEYGLYASILAHTVNDSFNFITYIGFGEGCAAMMEWVFIICGIVILILWIMHPNRKLMNVKEMPWVNDPLPPTLREQWGRH